MGLGLSKNVAAAMLALTSFHCVTRIGKNWRYARGAYRLYFFMAVLTLMKDWFEDSSEYTRLLEVSFVWSYTLGLPLLAADICRCAKVLPDFAGFHIMIPTATLIVYHLSPKDVDPYMLGVSHALSLFLAAFSGAAAGKSTPLTFTITYFIAFFRELNTPFEELMEDQDVIMFFMSIGNLLVDQFLYGSYSSREIRPFLQQMLCKACRLVRGIILVILLLINLPSRTNIVTLTWCGPVTQCQNSYYSSHSGSA